MENAVIVVTSIFDEKEKTSKGPLQITGAQNGSPKIILGTLMNKTTTKQILRFQLIVSSVLLIAYGIPGNE